MSFGRSAFGDLESDPYYSTFNEPFFSNSNSYHMPDMYNLRSRHNQPSAGNRSGQAAADQRVSILILIANWLFYKIQQSSCVTYPPCVRLSGTPFLKSISHTKL